MYMPIKSGIIGNFKVFVFRSFPVVAVALVFFSMTLFAADKPVWTIDYKRLNLPKTIENQQKGVAGMNYEVHFTPDGKVLISFLKIQHQKELLTKDAHNKYDTVFVVLLLSRETGELIKRVEMPMQWESFQAQKTAYDSRIYLLRSGGYVGIINGHLQVFDSSFNVVHDRTLEKSKNRSYYLITPLYGEFFVLRFWENNNKSTELIDSKTLETSGRLSELNRVIDIWGDKLLATSYSEDTRETRFLVKKMNTSQWNDLGLTMTGVRADAKYIYNSNIVVTDVIEKQPGIFKAFWFTIEDDKKGERNFGYLGDFKPSWNTSIIANKASEQTALQSFLDISGKYWVEAYDLSARQTLLETKKHSYIASYDISPNGDSVVLITKKKIELYKIPAPGNVKKK